MTDIFIKVSRRVVFDQAVSPEAKLVLMAYTTFADNKTGHCSPAADTVADRLGLGRRQVQRHLKALKLAGYLEQVGTRRTKTGNILKVLKVIYDLKKASPDDVLETSLDDALPDEKTSLDDTMETSSDDVLNVPTTTGKTSSEGLFDASSDDPQTRLRELERKKEKKERGATRFSPDAILPDDWRRWAHERRPDLSPKIEEVFEVFRNHWISKSGTGATKRDWSATWHNWVIKEKNCGQQHQHRNASHTGHRNGFAAFIASSNFEDPRPAEPLEPPLLISSGNHR
jgi:hypothetical protein